MSNQNTVFNSITTNTLNVIPKQIISRVTNVKNNGPTSNIINLTTPKTLNFDKITTTCFMTYLIGKSNNVYRSVPTVFTKEDNSNFLTDTFSIPSSFLNTDGETITVPFTYQMKYVGILKQCNEIPNTIIEGNFTVKRENENTYSLFSWNILSIDYNSNDFCSDDLSPYYFYDECEEVDDDECIEENIYDKLTEMFENAVVELNVGTNQSTVDVIFKIDTFHNKIKNMLGTYTLINSDDNSVLTIKFNENTNTFIELKSVGNSKPLPSINNQLILRNLTLGSKIYINFISGSRSGTVSSNTGSFTTVTIDTLNPIE